MTELVRLILSEGPHWKNRPADFGGWPRFSGRGQNRPVKPRAPIQDLDSLPLPAWDLIDYKKFWTGVRHGNTGN